MKMSSLELVTEVARHLQAKHSVSENHAMNLAELALVEADSKAARLAMDRDKRQPHENLAMAKR